MIDPKSKAPAMGRVRLRYATHESPWKGSPKHEPMDGSMTVGNVYEVEVLMLDANNEALNQCEVTDDQGQRIRILQGHFRPTAQTPTGANEPSGAGSGSLGGHSNRPVVPRLALTIH